MVATENCDLDPFPLLVTFPDIARQRRGLRLRRRVRKHSSRGLVVSSASVDPKRSIFDASQFDAAAYADAGRAGRCRHGRHLRSQPLPKRRSRLDHGELLIEVAPGFAMRARR
jgi:hypothetical protein